MKLLTIHFFFWLHFLHVFYLCTHKNALLFIGYVAFQLADPDSSQHMYNVLFVYACTIVYIFYEVLNIVVW